VRVSWSEKIKLVEAKKSNWMAAGVHRETLHNQHQIFGRNASERFPLPGFRSSGGISQRKSFDSMIQELALGLGGPSKTGR